MPGYLIPLRSCGGVAQQALVGGLDSKLKAKIAESISVTGVEVLVANHPFPAIEPMNICNRGRQEMGVQIEMTVSLRSWGPRDELCAGIRSVLLTLPK